MEQLRQMTASGMLGPTDLVMDEANQKWAAPQDVAGLTTSSAPEQPPSLTPGKQAAKPDGPPDRPAASSTARKAWPAGCGLVLLGVALGLLRYAGCLPEDFSIPGDRNAGERLAKEVASANAIPVSAQALTQEIRANDIAADQKYKGKVLEVSGTVSLVKGGATGPFGIRPFVQLGWIRCEFKANGEIQHLTAGQSVAVRGKYQGNGVLMYCILR
jgi:hypothetical protein